MGIDIAKLKRPDLIILDITLPGMNGFEALKVLQSDEQTKGIPVLALSAAATKNNIKNGIDAGFWEYLSKPIDIAEFTALIKKVLDAG